jgi:hypothetical protein
MTADEQKVLDHMAQERKREDFQLFLQSKLAAPDGPAANTKRNWAPLTRTGYIRGMSDG